MNWAKVHPVPPPAVLPAANLVARYANRICPARFSLFDEVNVLRFLVTRGKISPNASTPLVDLVIALNLWGHSLGMPPLSYASCGTALASVLALCAARHDVTLVHGRETRLLGLSFTASGDNAVACVVPPQMPQEFPKRMATAARSIDTFAPGCTDDDLITLKFLDLFTMQDMRAQLSQPEVERCYRLWAMLVGLPPGKASTVWVRIAHYATAYLNVLPHFGLPVRGLRLI